MSRSGIPLALALAISVAAAVAALPFAGIGPARAQQENKEISAATRALFDAVMKRDIVAARISLNDGADVDAENDDGQTAADLAVDSGYFDIAHLILAVHSQQRAAAQPAEKFDLPPPPAAYPSAPLLDEKPAPAPAPVPQVGPAVVSQPSVGVAEAPMTAPVPKVELPEPVSLFRPPAPNSAAVAQPAPAPRPAPAPEAAPERVTPPPQPRPVPQPQSSVPQSGPTPAAPPVASATPPTPPGPPENLWKPEVEPVAPTATSAAAPSPAPSPAPEAGETAPPPAANAAEAPDATTDTASEESNPVSEAISSVGNFFSRTFNSNGEGDSEVDTASGGTEGVATNEAETNDSATNGSDGGSNGDVTGSDEVARAGDGANDTPDVVSGPTLKGVALTLDGLNGLGRPLDPAEKVDCIARRRGTTFFCLEPARWPKDLAEAFDVTTRIYEGDQAVVRYDNGAATRMYAMFPSQSFAQIALYLQQRYGAPTQRRTQRRGIVSGHSRINVVLRWISEDPNGGRTVLEIRKIDDLRGMMPDTKTGVIRLFTPAAEEIFKYLSESDFVLHRVRESSRHWFGKK